MAAPVAPAAEADEGNDKKKDKEPEEPAVPMADEGNDKKKDKEPEEPAVPMSALYTFCSMTDFIMLGVSSIFSLTAGVAQPMMLVAFKDMFEGMGATEMLDGALLPPELSVRILLIMVTIGGVMGGSIGIATFLVEWTVAAQMLKYKQAYLKAVLRQDVGWYDTSNPEELSTVFAEATIKIQKGLKAQNMFLQGLGYGLGAIILAFVPGIGNWIIAAISFLPLIVMAIAATVMMSVAAGGDAKVAKAYGKAGGLATESLFSMRTIVSLGVEPKFSERYSAALAGVRSTAISNSTMLYFSGGLTLSSYLIMMAVGIVFGCYLLAGQMDASAFDFIVPFDMPGTAPGTSSVNYHYCAHANGSFANASLTPCANPMLMTCSSAEYMALLGETPLARTLEAQGQEVTAEYANMTYLEALGFSDLAAFNSFVFANGPPEYVSGRGAADGYDCRVIGTSMSGSGMLIAIFAIMMAGEGFGMIEAPGKAITIARQAAFKVFQIINRIPAIDSFSEEGAKPAKVVGEIEVVDVSFAFPSSPEHLVCKDFSLVIPAGQTVALCGPSGSGKSTIVQLLERFYDPLQGKVTLDGLDIKTLNVKWLRSQLGFVGQEPVLFQGSVAMNISYGKPGGAEASQAEIEEAAKMANAHEFIMETLGDGYQTDVGQGGSKLSGGQKQRVAIARAMIKKPPILLLDEATSALDTKSEKVVQAALDEIMTKQKRTTIVIAHRLSTIRNADKIAVLNEGLVAELGSYDALMEIPSGLFRTLAEKQEKMLAADKASMEGGGAAGGEAAATEAPGGEAAGEVPMVTAVVVGSSADGAAAVVDPAASDDKKKTTPEEDGVSTTAVMKRLFGMQTDHVISLLLLPLSVFSACALSTYSFYKLATIMEVAYEPLASEVRTQATQLSIEMLIYAAIMTGLFTLGGFTGGLAGSSLTAKLRARGLSAIFRQEIGYFDRQENSAAELTAFLAEKTSKIKTLTSESVDLIGEILGGFGGFIFVIFYFCGWQLVAMWLGAILLIMLTMPLQVAMVTGEDAAETKKKKGVEDKSKITLATNSANQIVGDAVMGIRTVASFNLEHRFLAGFSKNVDTVARQQKRDAISMSLAGSIIQFAMMGIIGVVFYFSIFLVNEKIIGLAEFNTPMFAMMGMMVPMMKASGLSAIPTAINAAKRFFTLMDRVPLINNLSEDGGRPSGVTGAIEVQNVVFAYPTAPDHLVCKGYSLSIAAGQTVALCGPSGSGKSTIINLLERFYDPLQGTITLDGVDIKSLNVRWLRSMMGYVGQEPVLFQGSVAMNISYGKPGGAEASQAEIEEAAKMANAHEFIMDRLNDGYQTDVGLKGGKLSGGQKQRVAIARAMIKKPPILLLDEATSALDNESERIVQAALDEIMTKQKLTTIVIAHRLSTIRNADKIAVVHEGAIAEVGTHDDLLANRGLYMNLVMAS